MSTHVLFDFCSFHLLFFINLLSLFANIGLIKGHLLEFVSLYPNSADDVGGALIMIIRGIVSGSNEWYGRVSEAVLSSSMADFRSLPALIAVSCIDSISSMTF